MISFACATVFTVFSMLVLYMAMLYATAAAAAEAATDDTVDAKRADGASSVSSCVECGTFSATVSDAQKLAYGTSAAFDDEEQERVLHALWGADSDADDVTPLGQGPLTALAGFFVFVWLAGCVQQTLCPGFGRKSACRIVYCIVVAPILNLLWPYHVLKRVLLAACDFCRRLERRRNPPQSKADAKPASSAAAAAQLSK